MATKMIECRIEGLSPLMMRRFPLKEIPYVYMMPPKDQAEHAAYRDDKTGQLYIPGENIYRALVSGARHSKGKGRMTLQKLVAAHVGVYPSKALLGTKDFIVDSRRVL